MKFGGTSVGTPERIRALADLVAAREAERPVVVVSAFSTRPFTRRPRIFFGSASIFSSSPSMFGMTFARPSSDGTPG